MTESSRRLVGPIVSACSWAAIATWAASAVVCGVGAVSRDQVWVVPASFVVGAVTVVIFVITTVVLSASVFAGRRTAKELRRAIAVWWGEALSSQKLFAVLAIGIGLCVTVVGILGSPSHADLLQRGGTFYFVTDAGTREITAQAFDDFRYSQYVLGVLGPAMALSGFLVLVLRAIGFALVRPDRLVVDH